MNTNETYDELAADYGRRLVDAEAWEEALGGDASALVADGYGDADDGPTDVACEFACGLPLEVRVERRVRIALTLGGPTVYLLADVDAEGVVYAVTYAASWGGTNFERRVPEDHALFRLAESYVDGVLA